MPSQGNRPPSSLEMQIDGPDDDDDDDLISGTPEPGDTVALSEDIEAWMLRSSLGVFQRAGVQALNDITGRLGDPGRLIQGLRVTAEVATAELKRYRNVSEILESENSILRHTLLDKSAALRDLEAKNSGIIHPIQGNKSAPIKELAKAKKALAKLEEDSRQLRYELSLAAKRSAALKDIEIRNNGVIQALQLNKSGLEGELAETQATLVELQETSAELRYKLFLAAKKSDALWASLQRTTGHLALTQAFYGTFITIRALLIFYTTKLRQEHQGHSTGPPLFPPPTAASMAAARRKGLSLSRMKRRGFGTELGIDSAMVYYAALHFSSPDVKALLRRMEGVLCFTCQQKYIGLPQIMSEFPLGQTRCCSRWICPTCLLSEYKRQMQYRYWRGVGTGRIPLSCKVCHRGFQVPFSDNWVAAWLGKFSTREEQDYLDL